MINRLLLVCCLFFCLPADGLTTGDDSVAVLPPTVQSKNYLLLTLIRENGQVRQMLENDTQLAVLNERINFRVTKSVKECGFFFVYYLEP